MNGIQEVSGSIPLISTKREPSEPWFVQGRLCSTKTDHKAKTLWSVSIHEKEESDTYQRVVSKRLISKRLLIPHRKKTGGSHQRSPAGSEDAEEAQMAWSAGCHGRNKSRSSWLGLRPR